METNENIPQEPIKPEIDPNKDLFTRFEVNEREKKEILEKANKVTNVKEASVESLELIYHELKAKDPNTAQIVLNELNFRGSIPELLEKEKQSIEEMRKAHRRKDIDEVKGKIVKEPIGSSEHTAKLLKLKNVKLPNLFSTKPGHANLINQGIDKLRKQHKKEK